ncbi:phosphopentomutase [soil metagenome]
MRALLLVLDSVGVGGAPDAEAYGDAGADTLGHIFAQAPALRLPTLESLGLDGLKDGSPGKAATYGASFGRMRPRSAGKDTTTGHWEIAGVLLAEPFATFNCFPGELVRAIEARCGLRFLGNRAASGTAILESLGPEHLRTGRPILYTSADSVLQIAAHEEIIPLERLLEICRIARQAADPYRIARVIARPFLGEPDDFRRTSNRHDFSMRSPRTVLDALAANQVPIFGIGKISDIFAGQGITESFPTASNHEGMEQIEKRWRPELRGLLFANLVDFDTLYGHRRDLNGYARALEKFDRWLGTFLPRVSPNDLVIITADHGNDPTFPGTDHTREEVPLFVLHREAGRDLGTRKSFADVAASLADYFTLPESWPTGESFLAACTSQP